jgi:hypothetical protein
MRCDDATLCDTCHCDVLQLKEFFVSSFAFDSVRAEYELLRDIATLYVVDERQWKVRHVSTVCARAVIQSACARVLSR